MRWIDRLALALGHGLAWGFLAIAVMMAYEVAVRYGLNAPTFWAHELAGVIAAVAFIFGGAYCMADRSHMRITFLADRLPPRGRRLAEFVSLIAGAIYLGGLAVAMWSISNRTLFKFAADGTWTPERSGTSWNTPAPAFVKFALLLGAVLFLIVILRQLWLLFRPSAGTGDDVSR